MGRPAVRRPVQRVSHLRSALTRADVPSSFTAGPMRSSPGRRSTPSGEPQRSHRRSIGDAVVERSPAPRRCRSTKASATSPARRRSSCRRPPRRPTRSPRPNGDGTTNRVGESDCRIIPRDAGTTEQRLRDQRRPRDARRSSTPTNPTSAAPATITAKVTDPEGVASVQLQYQIVLPGQYLPARLPVPTAQLIADGDAAADGEPGVLSMPPIGRTSACSTAASNGDAVAGDTDLLGVTLPRRRIARSCATASS